MGRRLAARSRAFQAAIPGDVTRLAAFNAAPIKRA
jgi:hypothetical protein